MIAACKGADGRRWWHWLRIAENPCAFRISRCSHRKQPALSLDIIFYFKFHLEIVACDALLRSRNIRVYQKLILSTIFFVFQASGVKLGTRFT